MIKKWLIFMVVVLYPLSGFSVGFIKDTSETQKCYDIVETGYSTNCMIDLSVKKKKEYGEMYNSFIDKIKKNKEDYNNYNDYIKGIRNAKKYFDKYIENQCTSYANIYIKNSPAYYTRYYHCKFSLYDERVNFYKNYQDQYG